MFMKTVTFFQINVIPHFSQDDRIKVVVEIWWSRRKSILDFSKIVQMRMDGLGNDATDHGGSILKMNFQ